MVPDTQKSFHSKEFRLQWDQDPCEALSALSVRRPRAGGQSMRQTSKAAS